MVDDAMAQQRPILHQSQHGSPPRRLRPSRSVSRPFVFSSGNFACAAKEFPRPATVGTPAGFTAGKLGVRGKGCYQGLRTETLHVDGPQSPDLLQPATAAPAGGPPLRPLSGWATTGWALLALLAWLAAEAAVLVAFPCAGSRSIPRPARPR